MSVPRSRTLNHFCLFAFTDAYWMLNEHAKASFHEHWLAGLSVAAINFDIYQNSDTRGELLVWCVINAEEPCAPSDFFEKLATIITPYRHLIRPVDSIWGFTREPSEATNSAQEIDPLATTRLPYLMAYPVTKAAAWELVEGDGEQQLRIDEAHSDVRQLILYSFGLEDRKFVVVYEAEDLVHFSDLVNDLRDSEAKRFVLQDTPAYTAVYHPAPQTLALWK